MTTDHPRCVEVRDLLPEVAAGVADGDARARALAHLSGCPDCRGGLGEITAVLDELQLLTPEHEPSAGFESSVLAALAPDRRRHRRTAGLLVGIAVSVLAAALTAGLVWRSTADDRRLAAQYRRTLSVADGRYLTAAEISTVVEPSVGHAFAYEGRPSWVFLTVQSAPWSGTYQVQLVTEHERTIDVGECRIVAGKGSWGWTVDLPVSEIGRIQLLRAGVPTMSATFG